MKLAVGLFLIFLSWNQPFAHSSINPEIIALIESSNNPNAFNARSGARGLFQITSVCLKHFNSVNGRTFTESDLFNKDINRMVFDWYIHWLSHHCSNDKEVLISFNWGIGNMKKWKAGKKKLPLETVNYLRRYHELKSKY